MTHPFSCCGTMDCFAEPVIGRAVARPVGADIFTAIKAGTVFGFFFADPSSSNAGWLSYAMTISYQNHPGLYIFIVSISVVAVPFYGALLYTYYFKKIPD